MLQLYERSTLAKEVGAAIHLAPNCHGILRRLGIFPESFGANPVHGVSTVEEGPLLSLRSTVNEGVDLVLSADHRVWGEWKVAL